MGRSRILVIAGSDSSGGAGIEADQRVIGAHGCYAMTATTALTAQNTQGVHDIHYVPSDFIQRQIECNVDDMGVDVVKIGMLACRQTVETVASTLSRLSPVPIILDPVMVSTSGTRLLTDDAVDVMLEKLLPLSTMLTPNIPEAVLLLQKAGIDVDSPKNVEDMLTLARELRKLGPQYIFLKGGHLPLTESYVVATKESQRHMIANILLGENEEKVLEAKYFKSRNTHGTGCSVASAIASNITLGMKPLEAVRAASQYVEIGVQRSENLGKGNGPINHFHSSYKLPFAPGYFIEYLLSRPDVEGPWRAYVEHEFVHGLSDGSLPQSRFREYLIQDYLYLTQFARANALASYKSKNIEDIGTYAKLVEHVQTEMKLHIKYCQGLGISQKEIESRPESTACTAYSRFVLDIGQSEDLVALQMCIAPCILGYGQIGQRLCNDPRTVQEGNPYWGWIQSYASAEYGMSVQLASEFLENRAVLLSPSRLEELVLVFLQATQRDNFGTEVIDEWPDDEPFLKQHRCKSPESASRGFARSKLMVDRVAVDRRIEELRLSVENETLLQCFTFRSA